MTVLALGARQVAEQKFLPTNCTTCHRTLTLTIGLARQIFARVAYKDDMG